MKLLDFGLAKAAAVAGAAPIDEAQTIAISMTGGGMIVGTAGYMAPEQARGKPVDKRADIWAFGVVLYEMLTGTQLFEGDTVTDVMASVVRQEPDLARVPASVRPLLRRCLEKDPKHRLRDVGDAMLLLETAAPAAEGAAPAARSRTLLWAASAAAAVLLIALVALSIVHFREAPPVGNTLRYTIALPEELTYRDPVFGLSPDGRRVVFAALTTSGPQTWVQELDALEPRALTGLDIQKSLNGMVWSPDSQSLIVVADGKMKRIEIAGGPVRPIGDISEATIGAAWHSNGTVLFGSLKGIMQIPATGGTASLVTMIDPARKETAHTMPVFLPDGRTFLYSGGAPGARAVYVGSLDRKPEEQSKTPILTNEYGATFVRIPGESDKGRLLYVRDGTLLAQPFDPRTQQLSGGAVPIAEQVLSTNGPYLAYGYFSASDQGTVMYRSGLPAGQVRQLTWYNREGMRTGALSEVARYNVLKVSPDGMRVVTSRTELKTGNNADLWVTDLTMDTSQRLTFGGGANIQSAWSPDGRQLAWNRARQGDGAAFYRKSADGSGSEELLYTFDAPPGPNLTDWTADGRHLVFARMGDVWALPVGPGTEASTRKPVPVIQGPGTQFGAYVSPDTRWIAYISDETGRQEMYVQAFNPGGGASSGSPVGGKWMVSRGTQGFARWRADGKELLFINATGALMAVDVTLSPVFKAGTPRMLFQLPEPLLALSPNPGAVADATRDHKRFLLSMPTGTRQELSVVVNWQNGVSR